MPRGENGVALVEFTLSIPLFLFMIWGLVTMVSLSRMKLQVAMVTHAVMREAAGGLQDEGRLEALGRAYARAIGMSEAAWKNLHVGIGAPPLPFVDSSSFAGKLVDALPLPKRVTVSVRSPIPDSLKLLTGPIDIVMTNDCLIDTWKNPWSRLLKLFNIPVPFAGKS